LRAPQRVHDGAETPSTITLKPASTIAEMRIVSLLQTLEEAGLGQHFTVVGTHALYAYEAAAGVRTDFA
jgi:hypothetical protein